MCHRRLYKVGGLRQFRLSKNDWAIRLVEQKRSLSGSCEDGEIGDSGSGAIALFGSADSPGCSGGGEFGACGDQEEGRDEGDAEGGEAARGGETKRVAQWGRESGCWR